MRDNSLRHMRDGRVFQMCSGFTGEPMPFKEGKHNYTMKDYDWLKVGQCLIFHPMYGNKNPVYTQLVRLT